MISTIRIRWLLIAVISLLAGCGPFLEDMAEDRKRYAEEGEGPIVVAVVIVDDDPGKQFINGVRLALREVNASDGGLLGRRVELMIRPGSDDYDEVRPTVRRIATDPRVTAVLGHRLSRVAIPASVVYEQAEVLFLPPFATSEALTRHGLKFTLRMLPDARTMAMQIASVASLFGYQRVAVLHSRQDYSRWTSFAFEEAARQEGIKIVYRGPFFRDEQNYRGVIDDLHGIDLDAIFLATDSESGARMLRQLRDLAIREPVLGSHYLGFGKLADLAGSEGDLTVVPTLFDSESVLPSKQRFASSYRNAYGVEPTQVAAQGYDSIQVLKTIIQRAGTTQPRALAAKAHFSAPIAGVTGIYAFDPSGNIYGKTFRFEVIRSGLRFSLPNITIPFLTEAFERWLVERGERPVPPPGQRGYSALLEPEPDMIAIDRGFGPSSDATGLAATNQGREPAPAGNDAEPSTGAAGFMHALTDASANAEERNEAWLSLVHEILEFEHLGLVASPAHPGGAEAIARARAVGRRRGFEVELCELPDLAKTGDSDSENPGTEPVVDSPELRNAALRCYALLARSADAFYVLTETGLSADFLKKLNRGLRRFDVPSFALGNNINVDYGLTFAVVGSGIDLNDPDLAFRFNGLLKDRRVHELNALISGLPTVAVDLEAFEELGLRPDPRSLTIASEVLESTIPDQSLPLAEEPR
jgi:branched-chain amino acid transport system substrate-binding protein